MTSKIDPKTLKVRKVASVTRYQLVRWAGGKPSTWFPPGGCRADTKTESERKEKAHEQRSKGKQRTEKLNNETNKETKKEEEEGEEAKIKARKEKEEGTRRKEKGGGSRK